MTPWRKRPADLGSDEVAIFERVGRDMAASVARAGRCPDPGRLLAARSGDASPEDARQILDHLQACPVCQTLADALHDLHVGDLHTPEAERLDRRVAAVLEARSSRRLRLGLGRPPWIAWAGLGAAAALAVIAMRPGLVAIDLPAVHDSRVGSTASRPRLPRMPMLRADRLDTSVMGLAGIAWRGDAVGYRPTSSFDDARRLFDEGDVSGAATQLDAITRRTPSFGDAWLLLGVARLNAGDAQAALAPLARARALLPRDVREDVDWHLAVALHAVERDADARELLDPMCRGTTARAGMACLALDELRMP
jgi:hypothetical protein